MVPPENRSHPPQVFLIVQLIAAWRASSVAVLLGLCLLMASARAATWYVAPAGSDSNSGSISSPFATVQRAQTAASAGDIVYVRGGTYVMSEAQISGTSGIYKYVTNLTKSGSSGARINYWAYPGERPIFDYTNVKPVDYRVVAFNVPGSWIHIRGLEITGVQVTITGHTQSECFENTGSNNIFEQCVMRNGMAIGFYLTRGSNNLVLNCDAYRNWDSVSEGGAGGNVDGFGGHPNRTDYPGNVFRGCRAWFNSDDGYDCINADSGITFENCWAFFNGYTSDFISRADGNGFKSGGYGANGSATPNPIPRHVTQFCLAVRNKASGFYSNHHVGGSDWISNTAYRNGTNYNMLSTLADNDTDVPGYDHFMRNNLGFLPIGSSLTNLDQAQSDVAYNFFNLPVTVTDADFASTTTDATQLEAILTQPRKANGELPDITLLHLVAGSDLINSGTSTGYPFVGSAPDLGAFEFGASTTTARTLTWKGGGAANAWDLNTTANWLFGTVAAKFAPTDVLVFDDTGSASPSANLSGQLWPGSVTVSGTQNYSFGGTGTLSGLMSLTKSGSSSLTISTSNSFSGGTTISLGTLLLGNNSALGTGGLTFASAGSSAETRTVLTNGALTISNAVTVNGGAVKTLGGNTANASSFTGNITVATGGFQVSQVSGGTLTLSGTITNSGSNRAATFVNAGNISVTGTITGTLTVTQSGTGTTTLSGSNTFTGGATLNAGTLVLGNASALGSGDIVLAGGTLATGTLEPLNSIVVSADSRITGGASNGNQGINAVSGSGVLTLEATNVFDLEDLMTDFTGTIVLTGANRFRFFGSSTALAGSALADWDLGTRGLSARSGSDIALGSLTGATGSTLGNDSSNSVTTATFTVGANGRSTTFAGAIQDGGTKVTTLIKTGTGTLTLSGSNSYTGATTISAGALLVTGSLGATPVSVASDATIGGTGTLGGNLTLASGARLALGVGASSMKGLTVSGTSTLNGSITVIPALLGGNLAPGIYNLLTYSGTLAGSPSFYWNDTTNSGYTATISTATAGQIKIALSNQTYSQWVAAAFPGETDQTIIGAAADPDTDGCPNLLEYFFSTSPSNANTPSPLTCASNGQGNIVLAFPMSKNLSNISYTVQQSADLTGAWSDANVTPSMVSDQGAFYQMNAVISRGTNTKLFVRLKVTGT